MSSLREFVSKEVVPAIIKDAREFRIFNEADLQVRVAHYLRKFVEQEDLYLLNQPAIRIGRGRGVTNAKPDLVICEFNGSPNPIAAFELKCFLEDADIKVPNIQSKIWEDIDALKKFGQRFSKSESEYVFFIALLDIEDIDKYEKLVREFERYKEPWMKHYLRVHLINMRSEIRRGYDNWANEWFDRQLKG